MNARKKVEEERKAEREGMSNPFEDELSTCDFLIRFCKKLLKDKEQKTVKIQKDHSRKEEEAKLLEDIKKQQEAGKIEFIKNKKEREEEDVLVIGDEKLAGRKKKKDRKKKARDEAFEIIFRLCGTNNEVFKYFMDNLSGKAIKQFEDWIEEPDSNIENNS